MIHEQAHIAHTAEISGWDDEEGFFVESASIEGRHLGDRTVILQHRVCQGTALFVRWLTGNGSTEIYPALHRAEHVQAQPSGGFTVSLVQLHPVHLDGGSPSQSGKHHI